MDLKLSPEPQRFLRSESQLFDLVALDFPKLKENFMHTMIIIQETLSGLKF